MAYYINLFSPDTHKKFTNSDKSISGFRERQKNIAANIKVGDKLICYVTKLSRWIGVFEVTSDYFIDDKPIFIENNDPFIVRHKVKSLVWLDLVQGIPVNDKISWNFLSFTKDLSKKSMAWTSMVRGSLRKLKDEDGEYLEKILTEQSAKLKSYPISDNLQKKLNAITVKTQDSKLVSVSVPEDEDIPVNKQSVTTQRESIQIQSLLAEIGDRMNMKIWIPRSDRQRVLDLWKNPNNNLLEQLPLNYDTATLKTIENIDVLWIKGRSIIRAFEVEHTTSIYSGILRMADLMALQPNLNIHAHIVAPIERKDKVLQEISRPVFAFLDKGPLSESCSFISYDSVIELSKERRLEYMTDSVLEEYVEFAEEANI